MQCGISLTVGLVFSFRLCTLDAETFDLCSTDTIARKLNSSDATEYAEIVGFFGPRVWGEPLNASALLYLVN